MRSLLSSWFRSFLRIRAIFTPVNSLFVKFDHPLFIHIIICSEWDGRCWLYSSTYKTIYVYYWNQEFRIRSTSENDDKNEIHWRNIASSASKPRCMFPLKKSKNTLPLLSSSFHRLYVTSHSCCVRLLLDFSTIPFSTIHSDVRIINFI